MPPKRRIAAMHAAASQAPLNSGDVKGVRETMSAAALVADTIQHRATVEVECRQLGLHPMLCQTNITRVAASPVFRDAYIGNCSVPPRRSAPSPHKPATTTRRRGRGTTGTTIDPDDDDVAVVTDAEPTYVPTYLAQSFADLSKNGEYVCASEPLDEEEGDDGGGDAVGVAADGPSTRAAAMAAARKKMTMMGSTAEVHRLAAEAPLWWGVDSMIADRTATRRQVADGVRTRSPGPPVAISPEEQNRLIAYLQNGAEDAEQHVRQRRGRSHDAVAAGVSTAWSEYRGGNAPHGRPAMPRETSVDTHARRPRKPRGKTLCVEQSMERTEPLDWHGLDNADRVMAFLETDR
jgi:hypothetical protein